MISKSIKKIVVLNFFIYFLNGSISYAMHANGAKNIETIIIDTLDDQEGFASEDVRVQQEQVLKVLLSTVDLLQICNNKDDDGFCLHKPEILAAAELSTKKFITWAAIALAQGKHRVSDILGPIVRLAYGCSFPKNGLMLQQIYFRQIDDLRAKSAKLSPEQKSWIKKITRPIVHNVIDYEVDTAAALFIAKARLPAEEVEAVMMETLKLSSRTFIADSMRKDFPSAILIGIRYLSKEEYKHLRQQEGFIDQRPDMSGFELFAITSED